uniref:J domain-containing protein n=1 Tax=Spongospora subterranea TaxID=70186 RepID=A0A0H5QM75_9EUKA|eukprot:CRZ02476.1 hypothetical protein [Spongospora subterranea]
MKICFYEILGVSRDCSDVELRKAYRQQALRWHPDKNINDKEVAEERFKLVQEAFETLNDPDERAFYDGHRTQILKEDDITPDEQSAHDPFIDVHSFFSSYYDGFFDETPNNFFTVFGQAFEAINKLEVLGKTNDRDYPEFGSSISEWLDVDKFYREWSNFTSGRSFTWASHWRVNDAPERRAKRFMEKENRVYQTKAKKKYIDLVTSLVMFVRKIDPRVKIHLQNARKAREEREKAIAAKELKQKHVYAAERQAWLAKEQERILAGEERRREAYGDIDDAPELDSEDEPIIECVACGKFFKSDKQYSNHERSKRHRSMVASLRDELSLEEQGLADLNIADDDTAPQALADIKTVDEDPVCPLDQQAPSLATDEEIFSVKPIRKKNKKLQKTANFGIEIAEVKSEDESITQTDEVIPTETKKSRRRAKLKSKSTEINPPEDASQSTGQFACGKCRSKFPSKTQLFKHLNNNPSHRALK